MVFWFMLLWITIIGLMFQPTMSNTLQNSDGSIFRQAKPSFCVLIWTIPFFFICMCTSFGDRGMYISHFEGSPNDISKLWNYIAVWDDSRLFYGIQGIVKIILIKNATLWFSIITFFQAFAVTRILRKYSENFAMSLFIFIASTMMISWMCNGIRQFIAVSLLFACTDWILEGKWVRFFILTFILTGAAPFAKIIGISTVPWFLGGVHQSAVIMFLLFFCIRGKAFNKRLWIITAIIVLLIVIGAVGDFLSNTAFQKDLSREELQAGSNPLRFLVSAIPVVLILIKKRTIDEIELPPIVSLSINASFVTMIIYFISIFSHGSLIGRLPIYTELYNLILIPWLIEKVYISHSQWIRAGLYGGYIAYFYYQVNIAWASSPYHSSILGI